MTTTRRPGELGESTGAPPALPAALPSGGTGPDPEAALAVVERAATAIANGDLQELNLLLHPRAVADLARLAADGDAETGPPITSFTVSAAGEEAPRRPVFDIYFEAEETATVMRVVAVKGAAMWRVAAVLSISTAGGPRGGQPAVSELEGGVDPELWEALNAPEARSKGAGW